MPYKDAGDDMLPDKIKAMPEDMRKRFVDAYNSVFYPCQEKGGDSCERSAMMAGMAAARKTDNGDNDSTAN